MSDDNNLSEDFSIEDILEVKRRARVRQLEAVYAADQESLERAAESIKAVLRGNAPIPRPQRFSSLDKKG
ncbi:hypothetical protein [Pseudomonas frederiksbergensis]|uniref:Uncharacterized protein n=1 Tax=Pseudomonas frederiksbergensis TaxID=104087 RepID=A0A423HMQ4_9PSED|nr:hypothetical protein [Pseudomonas frederiksbergensis]RON14453.1 hypothetical protein BK662_17900 [Pseudomonas frederiksbergensis]